MDTIVSAVFDGEDGSLGYRRGQQYDLLVRPLVFSFGATITVERLDGSGRCPYKNVVTFLQNWTKIIRIDHG